MGVTGVALPLWVIVDASVILAQARIGSNTEVSGMVIFQLGAIVVAGVLLVKFGMLLREWKHVLGQAAKVVKQLADLEDRMTRAESRIKAHDDHLVQLNLLSQEHATRLGLSMRRDILDEAAG